MTSNSEWLALMTAVSEELVDLHQRQMGTTDYRGFSGVNLIGNGDFATSDKWRSFAGTFSPHGSRPTGEWVVDTTNHEARINSGSLLPISTLVRYLPNVFLGQTYTLKYEVLSVGGSAINILLTPPDNHQSPMIPTSVGKHEVVVRLNDYYIGLLALYSPDAFISIGNIELMEGM